MKTVDAARGKWFGILRHFGLDEAFLRNRHGSCPLCGVGKDRYRWDDKDGSGSFFCSHCGSGDGMTLLMRYTGLDFAAAAKAVDEIVGNVELRKAAPQRDPRDRLRRVQSGLAPMDGINPVRRYLASRGLKPSPVTQYHPAMPYYQDGKRQGEYPAMVHLFRAPCGSPLTYHVTYLTPDGRKADVPAAKKVLPGVSKLTGGAIRLGAAGSDCVLGIAEGIETALAATLRTGIPCWAAYSAQLLESWDPPAGASVVVFGDHDASFAGQKAAYALAYRLHSKGMPVDVRIPETPGTDWADEVRA